MRRGVLASLLLALFTACASAGRAAPGAATRAAGAAAKPNPIVIHQERDFAASPHRVYEALLDSAQFAAFSGRAAAIDRELGGAFVLFSGHIVGRNLELVPDERIVQAWRVVDWPEGAYSIARFELKAQGSGTHLVFEHVGFPDGLHDHLAAGWEANYWSLMKKHLE